MLNEQGQLVFANRALDELLGVTWREKETRKRLQSDLLAPPDDLPTGQARTVERPWQAHRKSVWWRILFLPVTGPDGTPVGMLGQVQSIKEPPVAPKAADTVLDEQLTRLREEQQAKWGFATLPARSEPMQRVLRQVRIAITTDEPVTFIGESGTGKRALARLVHHQRHAAHATFAVLDCRVLTADAQRRQLLGHFDLPDPSHPSARGILALPGPGTLLIKRVFSLAQDLQQELVKSFASRQWEWKLVVSEQVPLEAGLADGRLIEPFYHQLSTQVIQLPPLRERREELADYCAWVLEDLRKRRRPSARSIDPAAVAVLQQYSWPGNLDELAAVLAAASQRSGEACISRAHLPKRVRRGAADAGEPSPAAPGLPGLDEILKTVERRLLEQAMQRFGGNKSKAAEHLRMTRARFIRRWDQLTKESASADQPS